MISRLPFLLLGLSTLGACATLTPEAPDEGPLATAADRHVIAVEQTAARLEIAAPSSATSLTAKTREDLGAFASGYLRYGHGAMVLSSPTGGANAGAAARLTEEALHTLASAGVAYAAMAPSTYDASGQADAPVIVSFARFEAHAPECAPLWEQDLSHQSDNQPWESFGCATQANLAAMIEDPHDLVRARSEDPRDSNRRTTVFEAYREGEHTHAERTQDERVTISNAVQ